MGGTTDYRAEQAFVQRRYYICRFRMRLHGFWSYSYHFFSLAPQGEHTCVVCLGTACYVKGAAALLAAVEREAGAKAGATTPDNRLSLMTARCLGASGIATAV